MDVNNSILLLWVNFEVENSVLISIDNTYQNKIPNVMHLFLNSLKSGYSSKRNKKDRKSGLFF